MHDPNLHHTCLTLWTQLLTNSTGKINKNQFINLIETHFIDTNKYNMHGWISNNMNARNYQYQIYHFLQLVKKHNQHLFEDRSLTSLIPHEVHKQKYDIGDNSLLKYSQLK